jgi:hypothetical protein
MNWALYRNAWLAGWNQRPLLYILIGAAFIRLWAAFGSPGYLMTDDHFLTVEVAGSWAVGQNNGDWIPGWGNEKTKVEGFSFLYPGICFAFYKTMHALDIHDPQVQQLVFRMLHGLWSLLTVFYVFKLAERLGGKQVAITAGLLMAFLGVMPLYVVRNLVEWAGHPFIIGGLYYLSFSDWKKWFLGAMFLGLAVGVRYQNAWIPIGWGIAYVFARQWKVIFFTTIVSFLFFFITQLDDVLLWGGKPFQHVSGYLSYNATHSQDYPGAPLTYLSWISYLIFPPVSLFLLWGTIVPILKKRWGIVVAHPMIWGLVGAVWCFGLFHILYPNRQERFMFPILPVFLVLGAWGWHAWLTATAKQDKPWVKKSWTFFWIINTIVLLVCANIYPKRARVESMYALYKRGDATNFVQDYKHKDSNPLSPKFYAGTWSENYYLAKRDELKGLVEGFDNVDRKTKDKLHYRRYPNYILFFQNDQLEERVAAWKKYYPHLTYCETIEPGFFDRLLHKLNPVNSLENVTIYKIPQEDIKDF